MSKLDDIYKVLELACEAEVDAQKALAQAEEALKQSHCEAEGMSAKVNDAQATLAHAQSTMELAAQQLIHEVDATLAGHDNKRKEAWDVYVGARAYVAESKAALATAIESGAATITAMTECEKFVDAANVVLRRAQKTRQEKAAAMRPLIASEFAGYCNRGLPKPAEAEAPLPSEATAQ